ncbi:MAG: hypothetical protein OEX00_05650 [Gammaproteobacteria bacterium]|nr:hypothetical protein [Gammaproteobacteria bacterium]
MSNKTENYKALEEIRNKQRLLKRRVALLFLAILFINTPIVVIADTGFTGAAMQALIFASMVSLFGLVFAGRVAIFLQKRHYKTRMPYQELLMYSEPEDLKLGVEESLNLIEKRRLEAESATRYR